MNVVERTNPSGRMGKLEETEAGEEVKGGEGRGGEEREGEQNPRGGWRKGGGLTGPGGCKANTGTKQAPRTTGYAGLRRKGRAPLHSSRVLRICVSQRLQYCNFLICFGCPYAGKLPRFLSPPVSPFMTTLVSSSLASVALGNGPRRVLHAVDRPPWVRKFIFFPLFTFFFVPESLAPKRNYHAPGVIQSTASIARLRI